MWACANFWTTRFCRWATRQWRSHQNTHKTFQSKSFSLRFLAKWFLCFYFWAVIWSYIVDLFAALHELAAASTRTLLKLASSVRALLKPYGDTLRGANLNYESVAKEVSKPLFLWLLKSSGHQSLPCLFDSPFFKCFEPRPYLVCHVTTIDNV